MYTIKVTGEFKRQMKLCQRRGYDMELLREVIRILSKAGSLPPEYHPHLLSGNRKGQWEQNDSVHRRVALDGHAQVQFSFGVRAFLQRLVPGPQKS